MHTGESEGEAGDEVMICREILFKRMEQTTGEERKNLARKLGLSEGYDEGEFDRFTITVESAIPR